MRRYKSLMVCLFNCGEHGQGDCTQCNNVLPDPMYECTVQFLGSSGHVVNTEVLQFRVSDKDAARMYAHKYSDTELSTCSSYDDYNIIKVIPKG